MKEEPESAGQRLAAWPGPSAKSAEILRSPSGEEPPLACCHTLMPLVVGPWVYIVLLLPPSRQIVFNCVSLL